MPKSHRNDRRFGHDAGEPSKRKKRKKMEQREKEKKITAKKKNKKQKIVPLQQDSTLIPAYIFFWYK